ncbi:hypothetical protein ACFFU8_18930 [Chromobacterium piscinae]|uniref:hypothetical protein n=1 Tax=Chromobacterium piscinae TaxID=686831 RepID=UPI001C8CB442|nr:hypothetical protein [Chromobacterium piscinae]MBX9296212.1 hypothetical protein [Chromobacterium vaccinii]MBX9357191.1 hypothetical protein [Chromobacterium vaccinii]MCD5327998.1 hypothetical protein [Chromobacterium piscinae]
MDSHDLAELLTGLASRLNNLMVDTSGAVSRQCSDLQETLTGQALAAIAKDLDHATAQYAAAVNALTAATQEADAATAALDQTERSIEAVAKVVKFAGQASALAAGVLA